MALDFSLNKMSASDIDFTNAYDVIVIGAGLSGLVAAHKILSKEPSLKCLILEATKRIGGQILSCADGELGARTIAADHHHIRKLCQDLGVDIQPCPLEPNNEELKRVWQIDQGHFAPVAKFEVNRFIEYCNLLAKVSRRLLIFK